MRIFIVDDDRDIRDYLHEVLERAGFECEEASDADSALARLGKESADFDVVLLDVTLPGRSGWDILEELRERGNDVPVIFLTGLGGTDERVKGLRLGADDYVAKPFEASELIARVEAVVRRSSGPLTLSHAGLRANLDNRSLESGGQPIALSPREFDVLVLLMRARGRVVERSEFFRRVWGKEDAGSSKSLDVVISRMKRKLDPEGPFRIQSVHWPAGSSRSRVSVIGYCLDGAGPADAASD